MKILREIFLLPVHLYRVLISPFKGGPCCRYTPSCSEYFLTSVRRFGIIKGSITGWARILRCRPRYFGGPDPVPDAFSWKASDRCEKILRARGRVTAAGTALEGTDECSVEVHGEEKYLSEYFHVGYYPVLRTIIPLTT